MSEIPTIIEAVNDENLFLPFLGDDESWDGWKVILRAIYGLPIRSKKGVAFFKEATGRDPAMLPPEGFDQFLGLCGRRSGKSRITSVVAAYEAGLGQRWKLCSPGEVPVVAVISPRKAQSKVIKNYVREIFEAPLLRDEIVDEQADGFRLKNNVQLKIVAGDGGVAIRSTSAICVCLDEIAFYGFEDTKVKNDAELVRACLPSLATTGPGKLLAISSPFSRAGWSFDQYERAFGKDHVDDILVVNGPSRLFNPTLPQKVVDAALKRDRQGASSEYLGHFRDHSAAFIGRELVESCVVESRQELIPRTGIKYAAAVDMSGGRHDASAICIGHKEDGVIIVDALHHVPAPHEPQAVVQRFARLCRKFDISRVIGDRFAASWNSDAWRSTGIHYLPSELNASEAYLELLPVLCTPDAIELLDLPVLINELCLLQRSPRNGKDLITHPAGAGHHDDACNTLALLVCELNTKRITVGAFR